MPDNLNMKPGQLPIESKTAQSDQALIQQLHERGEISTSDDGYFYYWPAAKFGGCISARQLRVIADHLDKLNAEWDSQIKDYFDGRK